MSRLVIVASVVALAAVSANCANNPGEANSVLGPSVVMDDAYDATMAKRKPTSSVPTSSIDLVVLDSTDGPNFGEHVTFDVRTEATVYPWVTLKCYQGGSLVSRESNAMYLGTLRSRTFTLGPTPSWQGGAADCTATLENWDNYSSGGKITALASTTFAVAP